MVVVLKGRRSPTKANLHNRSLLFVRLLSPSFEHEALWPHFENSESQLYIVQELLVAPSCSLCVQR